MLQKFSVGLLVLVLLQPSGLLLAQNGPGNVHSHGGRGDQRGPLLCRRYG